MSRVIDTDFNANLRMETVKGNLFYELLGELILNTYRFDPEIILAV